MVQRSETGQAQSLAIELPLEVARLPQRAREGVLEALRLAEQVKSDPLPRTIEGLEQILPQINELGKKIMDSLEPHKKKKIAGAMRNLTLGILRKKKQSKSEGQMCGPLFSI